MWRIRDIYPGSLILIFTHPVSRISDPGSKNSNKRTGWKKISCHTIFCSHKFHKIENYFVFEMLKKIIWATNFQRIIELFTQKIVNKLSKIWVNDPGSKIRDPEKTLFRIPGSKRQRIPDPNPQHASSSSVCPPPWGCVWRCWPPFPPPHLRPPRRRSALHSAASAVHLTHITPLIQQRKRLKFGSQFS